VAGCRSTVMSGILVIWVQKEIPRRGGAAGDQVAGFEG